MFGAWLNAKRNRGIKKNENGILNRIIVFLSISINEFGLTIQVSQFYGWKIVFYSFSFTPTSMVKWMFVLKLNINKRPHRNFTARKKLYQIMAL